MTAALEVRGLGIASIARDGTTGAALARDVALRIEPGRALALVGESGSGKSLVAQAIMGTLAPGLVTAGEVRIGDHVSPATDAAARRALWGRRIGLLPQEPWLALDPLMRAEAQVADVHRWVGGLDAARARACAREAFARWSLAGAERRYPFQLSGGMAQRVALAATLAGGAPLLVVDEPTKGLDAALRDEVCAHLRAIVEAGGAVLAITHDMAVARTLADRVAVMLAAEIVETGEAAQVLGAPRHPYTRRLLDAAPEAWPARADVAAPAGETVIAAQGIAKRYGTRTLFEHIDIAIRRGERIAIVGPSGTGKTTLGNVLVGVVAPDAGHVRRSAGLATTSIQKLYQDPAAAFPPRVALGAVLDDVLALHRLARSRLAVALERLRIAPALLTRRPGQVSGGELQRIALARALLVQPAVLFADEPTSRLDPITQRETFELLDETLASSGCALVLVTHDEALARKATDRRMQITACAPGSTR